MAPPQMVGSPNPAVGSTNGGQPQAQDQSQNEVKAPENRYEVFLKRVRVVEW